MSEGRVTCRTCDRLFSSEAIGRHEPICRRSAQKKRKVFDSAKQRAQGTDIKLPRNRPKPGQVVSGGGAAQMKKPQIGSSSHGHSQQKSRGNLASGDHDSNPPPKTHWRERHMEFINSIRAARGAQIAMKTGQPLPPPPPPSLNPDYIQCDYCGRRFNQKAAERHIPYCKEKSAMLPGFGSAPAKGKVSRPQYIAPRPSKRGAKTAIPGGNGFGRPSDNDESCSYSGSKSIGRGFSTSDSYDPYGNSKPAARGLGASEPYDPYGSSKSVTRGTGLNDPYQPSGGGRARVPVGSVRSVKSGGKPMVTRGATFARPGGRNISNNNSSPTQAIRGSSGSSNGSNSSFYQDDMDGSKIGSGRALRTGRTPESYTEARQLSAKQRQTYGTRGFKTNSPSSRTAAPGRPGMRGGIQRSTVICCDDCGAKFPSNQARFCSECGMKRLTV